MAECHPPVDHDVQRTDLRKDCCSFMDNNNKTRALQALVTGPAGRTPWTAPHTSASSACASPSCRTWQPDQSADRDDTRAAPHASGVRVSPPSTTAQERLMVVAKAHTDDGYEAWTRRDAAHAYGKRRRHTPR